MYLLDTNVVSELRKAGSGKADTNVVAWAEKIRPAELFISVITLMELEMGVLAIERKDERQGKVLRRWLENGVKNAFENRVISIDANVAIQCARLHVPNPKSERDALIAATALVHKMTVATQNTKDFDATGVELVNPWV